MKLNPLFIPPSFPLLPIFLSLSRSHHRHPSAAMHCTATFTPSIQPNLGLPRTRTPLTSTINTLLAIRNSSVPPRVHSLIHSTRQLPFYSSSFKRISSFLTVSIRDNPANFSNSSTQEHALSFSQRFSYSMHLLCATQLVQLLHYIQTSSNLSPCNPLLLCTLSKWQPMEDVKGMWYTE